jgi:hypothetical protein
VAGSAAPPGHGPDAACRSCCFPALGRTPPPPRPARSAVSHPHRATAAPSLRRSLRRRATAATHKVEGYHGLSQWLGFGTAASSRTTTCRAGGGERFNALLTNVVIFRTGPHMLTQAAHRAPRARERRGVAPMWRRRASLGRILLHAERDRVLEPLVQCRRHHPPGSRVPGTQSVLLGDDRSSADDGERSF